MNKALFLDLDGTIIKTKSGDTFPRNIDDWEIVPGILPRIRAYSQAGYYICIVTNQGGIEKGFITREQLEYKLDKICQEISQYIGRGVNQAWCGNMESYFRKPNPGMAYQFAINLELNLRESVMIGDMDSDNKFAKNAFIGVYQDVNDFISDTKIRTYEHKI